MILLAVFVILLIFFVYWILTPDKRRQDFINNIPGPPLYPIIGNLPALLGRDFGFSKLITENREKYGDKFRFVVGNELMYFTSDIKDIETVVANTSNKADFYRLIKNFMGTSIFLLNGEEAKQSRKILIPSFHSEVLSNYSLILEDAIKTFMRLIDSKGKGEININYWLQLFTLDVLMETAMGVKLNMMENEHCEFIINFRRLLECWDYRWTNIFYQSDLIYYSTKVGKLEKESADILSKFCNDVINMRRKAIENNEVHVEGKKVSMLDALLLSKDQNGESLSQDHITYEVRGLMIAGHETTFTTIGMTLYQLCLYQDLQQKLYEEQVEIFGNEKDRISTVEDIQHMKELEKTIKETLRICSTVPTIGRKALRDIELDGGVILPKGCNIFISLFNMGSNEKIFENPDVFDITRWDEDKRNNRSAIASIPFSFGARNCLGQAFAMWEMKCVLSQLIRNYKMVHSKDRKLELMYGLSVKPKDGMYLYLTKRS